MCLIVGKVWGMAHWACIVVGYRYQIDVLPLLWLWERPCSNILLKFEWLIATHRFLFTYEKKLKVEWEEVLNDAASIFNTLCIMYLTVIVTVMQLYV